ncbi:hypothetical protein HPP92_018051 [Vanilla planifolia]|uniref:Cupin type-1 domain-containing protein n=1 Tax=Vanilla planifolia TaxID=51239 RepID=A0A835QHA2_VANPL|nr:hypothetical protein HPP92_018051 [Vanilla planifolia]
MATTTKSNRTLLVVLLLCFSSALPPSSASDPEEKDQKEKETETMKPFFFDKESFRKWGGTKYGSVMMLKPFSSEIFRRIEDYRFAVMEAEPLTFLLPSHFDAMEVFYVIQGRGIITLICTGKRETFEVKKGDVMMIPAGTVVYGSNCGSNEKLRVAMLFKTMSTPGKIKEFFGAGGKNPTSFYRWFSKDVVEAFFNTDMETIEKAFSYEKGSFVRATPEQIKAMKEAPPPEGVQPSERSLRPFNLLQKKPIHANELGKLFHADRRDCKHLEEMNVDIAVAEISKDAMMGPRYNTEATKLAFVMQGKGFMEMVAPPVPGEEGKEEKMVRAELSPGSVFVTPPGHPMALVATGESNLEVLCFGIKTGRNMQQDLGGRDNVLKMMDRTAMELSFGGKMDDVERVLNAQTKSVFYPGPKSRHGLSSSSSFLRFVEF